MTTVIAGTSLPLLAQFYEYSGGPLVNLDATPSLTITNIGTAAVALATTTTGVTHPGTGAYGRLWTPSAALAAGSYLVEWAGLLSGAPITAQETITVLAAASAAAANTSPYGVWYCTRERVQRAAQAIGITRLYEVDQAIETGARAVERAGRGRRYYPTVATRYVEWPNRTPSRVGAIWLSETTELISLSSVLSGGVAIDTASVLLEPVNDGPPYTRLELDRGTSAAFGYADTSQRSLALAGVFGGCPIVESAAGALAEALDDSETEMDVTGTAAGLLGVGSIVRVDSERVIVTERSRITTGTTLAGGGLTASMAGVSVTVSSGTGFAVGEIITIDAEDMLIQSIAGAVLTVKRQYDGTALAAHSAAVTVYASRRLTVTRGALGTTAAAHADATALYRYQPPGPAEALNVAEALNQLSQESSSYGRTIGSGDNVRELAARGLKGAREAFMADPYLVRQRPRHRSV